MTIEQRTMIRFGSIIGPFLMVLFHFPGMNRLDWLQYSRLICLWLLNVFILFFFSAAAPKGQTSSFFTVQTGDKITLSCENVRKDQKNCDRTTWTYRNFMQEGTIFENGQINKDATTDSSRLSLTANCSLVIKKVTLQDAGLYTCRQNLLANQDSQESLVDVSVIRGECFHKNMLVTST